MVRVGCVVLGVCSVRCRVQGLRDGLVFEAHRLLYHSTLGLRVIKKQKKGAGCRVQGAGCRVQGAGCKGVTSGSGGGGSGGLEARGLKLIHW